MLKKRNHKIFNLIIMIVISIGLLTIPNICNATEYFSLDSPYLLADQGSESTGSGYKILEPVEADYIPKYEEDKDLSQRNDKLFSTVNNNNFTKEIKKNVAQWYYIFRYMAIAIMLVILIILAIKMAITSVAAEKALYKRMLVDWLVCFILLHFIHYFMIFVLYINESLINIIKKVSLSINTNGEYSLYETVRSRAYDWKFIVGFSGMLLYMNLVWFTCKFVYIYAKRFITTIILTVIAPIMVLFYSLKKILTGSSKVLTKWMEEYALNVILQTIHALLYAVFVGIALKLTESSLVGIIISLIILNFMSKADKIFRGIFKFSDGGDIANENSEAQMSELVDNVKDAAMLGVALKHSEIAKDASNLGKKALGIPGGLAARTGIRVASTLGLGEAMSKFDDWSAKRGERGNDKFNKKIEKAEKQMKFTSDYLAKHGDRLSDKTKKAFEDKLKKAAKQHVKNNKKKSAYNTRRAIYQRMRNVLDPDTYMEFERDENGEIIKKKNGKYKRRTISTKKVLNPQTGEKEVIQNLSSVFKNAKKEVFGFTDEEKELFKEYKEFAKNELMGIGGMMLGMAAIADNPSIGFALLTSGTSRIKKISNRKRKGFHVSRKMKRAMRKVAKQERKKYTVKAFSSGALLNIDSIIREFAVTDPDVGRLTYLISQMENGGYKLVTLPFKVTGTKGIFLNILDLRRKVADQTKKDIADYERDVSVKLIESITKEVVENHKTVYNRLNEYIEESEISELVEQSEVKNGNIFSVTDSAGITKQFRGGDKYSSGISDEIRIKNALINTAIKMNVLDVKKLDFRNGETRKALITELRNEGLVSKDIEESISKINEIIRGKKDSDGHLINKGIIHFARDFANDDPNAVKNRIYQQTTKDYMINNGIFNLSEQDNINIRQIYTNKITANDATSNLNTLLVSMALANGNLNVKDITAEDVLRLSAGDTYRQGIDLFKQAVIASNDRTKGNVELFKKFNDVAQGNQIGSIDDFRAEIENRKNELNQTINDVIIGALANNNIADVALISASPNDSRVIGFLTDVINLLKFAGLQNEENELKQIVDNQIEAITPENIEEAIIKDEMQKYIQEEFDGDFEKFKNAIETDEAMKQEFEEKVLERLKDANKDTDKAEEIEGILDSIRGGEPSDETINKSKEQALNDFDIEEDKAQNIPYPEVKTTIKDDSILYNFSVPSDEKAKDCVINVCKIDADGNKGKWIEIDNVDLREEEKIIARLVNKNGFGPSLILSYPKPITSVISGIEKNKQEEPEDIDDVELNVMSQIKEYDQTATAEEKFGTEIANGFNDSVIEELFKEREKTSAVNKISDVMSSMLDYRKRLSPDDSKTKEIIDDAIDTFDGLMSRNASDRDEFEQEVDAFIDTLLQQKMASDDADSVKINKNRKKYKKYRQFIFDEKEVTSKNIADANFEKLIQSLNN